MTEKNERHPLDDRAHDLASRAAFSGLRHTPGPWHRNISAKYPVYAETETSDGKRDNVKIASILHGAPETEREANLSLIAAAPDLLELLIFLCNVVEAEPIMSIYKPHIAEAREIIAKATA